MRTAMYLVVAGGATIVGVFRLLSGDADAAAAWIALAGVNLLWLETDER
jgi:hypothetical protein